MRCCASGLRDGRLCHWFGNFLLFARPLVYSACICRYKPSLCCCSRWSGILRPPACYACKLCCEAVRFLLWNISVRPGCAVKISCNIASCVHGLCRTWHPMPVSGLRNGNSRWHCPRWSSSCHKLRWLRPERNSRWDVSERRSGKLLLRDIAAEYYTWPPLSPRGWPEYSAKGSPTVPHPS